MFGVPGSERLNHQPARSAQGGEAFVVGQKQVTVPSQGACQLDGIRGAQGRVSGPELYQGLLIQLLWVLAAYGLARWVWYRGIRKYAAVGG